MLFLAFVVKSSYFPNTAKQNKTATLTIMKFNYNRDPLKSPVLVTSVLNLVYWGTWHSEFINNAWFFFYYFLIFFFYQLCITWKIQIEVWVLKISLEKCDLTMPGLLCSWIAFGPCTWGILYPGSHSLHTVSFTHSCYRFGTLFEFATSLFRN